jgi:hypothetical protein
MEEETGRVLVLCQVKSGPVEKKCRDKSCLFQAFSTSILGMSTPGLFKAYYRSTLKLI